MVDKALVFELLSNDYEQRDEAVDADDLVSIVGLPADDCETVDREYGLKLVAHLAELGICPVALIAEYLIG